MSALLLDKRAPEVQTLRELSDRLREPAWLRAKRRQAFDALEALPLPQLRSRRLELDWRAFEVLLPTDAPRFEGRRARLRLRNGMPIEESGSELPRGVVVLDLETATERMPELLARYFQRAVQPHEDRMTALNAAFRLGGVVIYVPEGVEVPEPILLEQEFTEPGVALFPYTLLIAAPGSRLVVIDELRSPSLERSALTSGIVEIFAEASSSVQYVGIQRWGAHVLDFSTRALHAHRDAAVRWVNVSLGARLSRVAVRGHLLEPGVAADLLGLYVADADRYIEHDTLQDHVAPHTMSDLLFKGVLRDHAVSVYSGLIRVHPKAQKTNAYQANRNLLLSRQARADSIPMLEIEANDVRCTHGASLGPVDEEHLFYMMARGLRREEAEHLIVLGFLQEVLERIPIERVRQEILDELEAIVFRSA
ncbi:MAG: Fe-S cluster assembly protein SufD [Bacteroidetes bacterium]|nr:Fe-S cluster assembly protein SufD [Rhodothermia bacterium]MCS7155162.1 Fe-S cluster assembly protein SufD [Bacteroidota bacterium]MCX7906211.1 Fe-S cluster assembly protein SufD [Bacteroidota bacterium]MDW8138338.1 Fe-S cluster assembly protein SufD [Bacteroidota bacterium]MDW8286023.1 Fe-S cluster assembly protein SufD [Bacteroidota bacterium]